MKKLFLSLLIIVSLISCSQKERVDLFVFNATIYTVDSSFNTAEAMVVKDGKIVATGKTAELEARYEATEKLDVQGKFIYPGFIDSLTNLGLPAPPARQQGGGDWHGRNLLGKGGKARGSPRPEAA